MLSEQMMSSFDWEEKKNQLNQKKHGVCFEDAQYAFADPKRVVLTDEKHSQSENVLEKWVAIS